MVILLEFAALLSALLGMVGAVASPAFRTAIANIAAGIIHHIANTAYDAYMFLRRVLVITTAATILSLSTMFHFGAVNSLLTILVIFTVLFFLFGEIYWQRAAWYAGIALGIWLVSLAFGAWGSPALGILLAIVAVFGALFLLIISSTIHRLFGSGPTAGLIGVLFNTGTWFGALLSSIFACWMIAMLTAALLFQLGQHQNVYDNPMLLITLLILGGLLQFGSSFVRFRSMRVLAAIGQFAILLMFILPIAQYIPGPWQSIAHYASVREHAWSTARVKEVAATGRNYYQVSAPTAAYLCDCVLVPSDSNKPKELDSLRIKRLTRLDTLPAGTELVSFGWRPTERNGVMLLGVHRKLQPGAGIGYDMPIVYLVNTADLPDGTVEPAARKVAAAIHDTVTVIRPAPVPVPVVPEPVSAKFTPAVITEPEATIAEPATAQVGNLKFELIGCFDRIDAVICKTYITNTGDEDAEVHIKANAGISSTRAITDAGDAVAPESLPESDLAHSARKVFEIGFPKQASATNFRAVQLAVLNKELIKENGKVIGSTTNPWFVEFSNVAIHR